MELLVIGDYALSRLWGEINKENTPVYLAKIPHHQGDDATEYQYMDNVGFVKTLVFSPFTNCEYDVKIGAWVFWII